jgi:cation diffusion facilitator CzcD-associated flavoprotein CzcO
MRSNVTLVSDPITTVTEDAIHTASDAHAADIIVMATGYQTDPFVPGISIVGKDAAVLHDRWSERPIAFLGLTVPDFPNMFLVYGPNTNLGSGSIIYMLESQARHIVAAVRLIGARDCIIEVSGAAYERYRQMLSRKQRQTVWSGCRSWYHDSAGHDTHNWPWLMSTYRRRTRRIRLRDYSVTPRKPLP